MICYVAIAIIWNYVVDNPLPFRKSLKLVAAVYGCLLSVFIFLDTVKSVILHTTHIDHYNYDDLQL